MIRVKLTGTFQRGDALFLQKYRVCNFQQDNEGTHSPCLVNEDIRTFSLIKHGVQREGTMVSLLTHLKRV